MKIRNGFVSNSSSSSFIIKDLSKEQEVSDLLKSCHNDYYILHDKIFTSFVSDGYAEWSQLFKLADNDIDGGHGTPYDDEDFVEFEGVLGITSVYISKEEFTDDELIKNDNIPYNRDKKLYHYVKNYTVNTDSIYGLSNFYNHCKEIVNGEYDED